MKKFYYTRSDWNPMLWDQPNQTRCDETIREYAHSLKGLNNDCKNLQCVVPGRCWVWMYADEGISPLNGCCVWVLSEDPLEGVE